MMISMKNTAIAAAMACALLAGKASALPQAYTDNPENYRVAYASVMEHATAGHRSQVIAELPRLGVNTGALNPSDLMKYENGIYSFDDILARAGYTSSELTPPAQITTPAVTMPLISLMPSQPPAQQPPQDNGAAAAAKAAQLAAAQKAGITAGQAVQPVAWTELQPSTAAAQTPPAQLPPAGDAALSKAALGGAAQTAGKQAGLDAAAATAQQKADQAAKDADHSHFVSRITIADYIAKQAIQLTGGKSPYLHDDSGYYVLSSSDTQKRMEEIAKTNAQLTQGAADAAKAAAEANRAQPVTQPTTQPVIQPEPTTEPVKLMIEPARPPQPQEQRKPEPIALPEPEPEQVTTPPAQQQPTQQQPARQAVTQAPTTASTTTPAAQLADPNATQQAAPVKVAGTTNTPQPPARSSATAGTVSEQACTSCSAANCDAASAEAQQAQRMASVNTGAIGEQQKQIGQLNQNFKNLRSEVEANKEEARAGIAAVTAMANIPSPRQGERAMLGAAVGQFKNSSAIAVGLNVSATESVALRFSISAATNGDTAAGVGAGIGF